MKIRIRRRGGFAGVEETIADLDTAALSETEAGLIGAAVEKLRAEQRLPPIGTDFLRYEIEIAQDEKPATTLTVVDEGRADDPATAAVAALTSLFRVGSSRRES